MTVLGILLLVMSIVLIVAILFQSGKSKRLSGSIAGGAETFFGKAKSRTIDAWLSKLTIVVAVLFGVAAIIAYAAFGSVNEILSAEDILDSIGIEDGDIVVSGNELIIQPGDTTDTDDTADAETTDNADAAGDAESAETTDTENAESAETEDNAESAEATDETVSE